MVAGIILGWILGLFTAAGFLEYQGFERRNVTKQPYDWQREGDFYTPIKFPVGIFLRV